MGLLGKLGQGQGYLKAGFLGFQKSGKTWTAMLLAIGVRKYFELAGPIAMYDTEVGSEYVAPLVLAETGTELMGVRSRSFKDMVTTGREALAAGCSVLVVDSVTHPWRELCDSYLTQVNEKRRRAKLSKIQKLEFQHWGAVKSIWQEWTDFYVNAPLHIIICGRAGFEYTMEENDETHRKELNKTGIRMKTEGEFGFEPSLLVEMERVMEPDGAGSFKMHRRATVLGDRFNKMDGATGDDPTFEFFLPHIAMLKAGAHATVDTASTTDTGADVEGDTDWHREKRTRQILCEEIEGELVAKYPGMTKDEKKAKADAIFAVFNTRSWTAVEGMHSDKLRQGLTDMRNLLRGTTTGPEVLCACPDGPNGEHLTGCTVLTTGAPVTTATTAEEAPTAF